VVTKERFEQGLTLQQYVDHMSVNRERFVEALDEVTIRPDDWCGTCLAHVPFVAKLVEGRANIEMRLFPRDSNLDLMDQYLKKGRYRSIPVFAFFDEHMNELARFLETRPS
jgi:Thioredoxin